MVVKSPNRVAGRIDLPAPTSPGMRVRTRRSSVTGAVRFARIQIERHRRLAPVADLCVGPSSVS